MHLFFAFLAQMLVEPIFRCEYLFAMTASRLIAYISLRMLHETCHGGKRRVAELAMVIFRRMTWRLADRLRSFLRGCCLRCLGRRWLRKPHLQSL